MAERTIVSPHYSWVDENEDLHTQFRGEIIEISDVEAAKGDALNCFLETRVEYPKPGTDVTPAPEADFAEDSPPPLSKRTARRGAKPTTPETHQ